MEKRNRYTPEFKTKVVLEVLQEVQTVNEIASKYELSPVMNSRWKAEFISRNTYGYRRMTRALNVRGKPKAHTPTSPDLHPKYTILHHDVSRKLALPRT